MWFKVDDGIASHPKILNAGPLALALQIRALCYASQNQTDGFLPFSVIPYLVLGLPTDISWPNFMIEHRLWESDSLGYRLHDFLQWNVSKAQRQEWQNTFTKAGRKGAEMRWGNGKRRIATPIAKAIATPIGHPNSPPIASLSTSTSTLNPLNSPKIRSNGHTNPKLPIPEDWVPKETHQKLASARGLELNIEAVHFKGKAKEQEWLTKDWDQKFTNWMLQEIKFRQARKS